MTMRRPAQRIRDRRVSRPKIQSAELAGNGTLRTIIREIYALLWTQRRARRPIATRTVSPGSGTALPVWMLSIPVLVSLPLSVIQPILVIGSLAMIPRNPICVGR